MRRREFLHRGAVAVGAAGGLAGCTTHTLQEAEREPAPLRGTGAADFSLPVTQRLEVAAAAIEAADDVGSPDEFEGWLDEQGVDVQHFESIELDGDAVRSLGYLVPDPEGRPLMRHVGHVAGGYATLVASSDDSDHLEATVHGPEGRPFGEYEVRRHWALDFDEGAISARAYAREVAVTLASV